MNGDVAVIPMTVAEARAATEQIRRIGAALRDYLADFDERKGWVALGHDSFTAWAHVEFPEWGSDYARKQLRAGQIQRDIVTHASDDTIVSSFAQRTIPEGQLRPLTAVPREARADVWREAVETAPNGRMTAEHVTNVVRARRAEPATFTTVGSHGASELLVKTQERTSAALFNRTNENVDWAWWTWNPVTGCLHNCDYCYAREIAYRFYPQKFEPTFHPDRLSAPRTTRVPESTNPRARRVFTCSMADLFGKWVPQEWIDAVFAQVRDNPQWDFLFLTKFPQRLAQLDWPANAWVGTSVDEQHRVAIAEKSFRGVTAGVKWLSCEPMLERLTFSSLEMFDWVVIGAQSATNQPDGTHVPEFQPEWEWVLHLIEQARAAGCKIFIKDNLKALRDQPRLRRV